VPVSIDSPKPEPETLVAGPLEIRPHEYQVLVDGRRLHLTVREFQTLWALAREVDTVLRRTTIYERVWGRRTPFRVRAVDAFVHSVRIKLAEAAPGWSFIHTHFGVGYRFAPEPIE
jgi:DNA-binding response OmpR family regulator